MTIIKIITIIIIINLKAVTLGGPGALNRIISLKFEELFLEILGDLKVINKLDKNSNKELVSLVKAYEKIGDIIGAGVEV